MDAGAFTLFLIVFLWQIPHFLAIAWVYREQYARAGLLMLPVVDSDGKQTGRQMLRFTLLLIVASLLPFAFGQIHWISALTILILADVFLFHGPCFYRGRQPPSRLGESSEPLCCIFRRCSWFSCWTQSRPDSGKRLAGSSRRRPTRQQATVDLQGPARPIYCRSSGRTRDLED